MNQPDMRSCVKHENVVGHVPKQTMVDVQDGEAVKSWLLMLMGSLYEGALFVLFEMVVYHTWVSSHWGMISVQNSNSISVIN